MEASSLTQAHAHARVASKKTQSHANAAEEHTLAAGEFAKAKKSTGDAEVALVWAFILSPLLKLYRP